MCTFNLLIIFWVRILLILIVYHYTIVVFGIERFNLIRQWIFPIIFLFSDSFMFYRRLGWHPKFNLLLLFLWNYWLWFFVISFLFIVVLLFAIGNIAMYYGNLLWFLLWYWFFIFFSIIILVFFFVFDVLFTVFGNRFFLLFLLFFFYYKLLITFIVKLFLFHIPKLNLNILFVFLFILFYFYLFLFFSLLAWLIEILYTLYKSLPQRLILFV